MNELKLPANARSVPEYEEGKEAFGRGDEHCPYLSIFRTVGNRTSKDHVESNKRIAWWTGWLDARRWKRLGHLYREHGWKFPEE